MIKYIERPAASQITELGTMALEDINTDPDATLSGTPKVMVLNDESGTPYYVKAYPTKS